MKKFNIISRVLKYKGNILKFYADTILLPDGSTVEWDYIEHGKAVIIIPEFSSNEILMVKQYRSAFDSYTLELPSGSLNCGEDAYSCAKRELLEETGYLANKLSWLLDVNTWAYSNEVISVYIAKDLNKFEQNLEKGEQIEVCKYKVNELVKMIFKGAIKDGKTIVAILSYYIYLNKG